MSPGDEDRDEARASATPRRADWSTTIKETSNVLDVENWDDDTRAAAAAFVVASHGRETAAPFGEYVAAAVLATRHAQWRGHPYDVAGPFFHRFEQLAKLWFAKPHVAAEIAVDGPVGVPAIRIERPKRQATATPRLLVGIAVVHQGAALKPPEKLDAGEFSEEQVGYALLRIYLDVAPGGHSWTCPWSVRFSVSHRAPQRTPCKCDKLTTLPMIVPTLVSAFAAGGKGA